MAALVDELRRVESLVAADGDVSIAGTCSSIKSAASRSAPPLALSNSAFTIKQLRLFTSRLPLYLDLDSLPLPLRASSASESDFDSCVWLERFSPWTPPSDCRNHRAAARPACPSVENSSS